MEEKDPDQPNLFEQMKNAPEGTVRLLIHTIGASVCLGLIIALIFF